MNNAQIRSVPDAQLAAQPCPVCHAAPDTPDSGHDLEKHVHAHAYCEGLRQALPQHHPSQARVPKRITKGMEHIGILTPAGNLVGFM